MEYARSSYEKTASCVINNGVCALSSVEVITDGSNPATVMLFDNPSTDFGDVLMTTPTLAIGSDTSAVSNIAFTYTVNGTVYSKAAVAAGTEPGNDVIPQNKYGAVALDIGADGTVDVIEAADNATGYGSAALAIAGIAAVAADHVRMGTVTVIKTDGDFTFGTTALNAANATAAYTSATPTTFNKLAEFGVAGATLYGGRNWTKPVKCQYGILLSVSGTGASAIVEYI